MKNIHLLEEWQPIIILFDDDSEQIQQFSGNSKFINMLTVGMPMDNVKWESFLVKPPSFKKKNTEVIHTIGSQEVLVYFHKVEQTGLNVMTMVNMTEILILNSRSNDEGKFLNNDLLFVSDKMNRIIDIIFKAAEVNSTILLLGESGVGKTKLAHFIHEASNRATQPFISINCGAIPETLIESELFGYVEGSFTGGKRSGHKGLFEEAHQGTIFLDEVAELSKSAQVKLLEVLQDSTFRKIGSSKTQDVDVRIIAATNQDLKTLVEEKKFREDLYYRLHVVPLRIPPLRERKDEIPALINHFHKKYTHKYAISKSLDEGLFAQLKEYSWPGNVRELENAVERIVVTNSFEPISGIQDEQQKERFELKELMPLKEAKKMVEIELITKAYQMYKSTYKAAKALEVDQSTIAKKVKLYNIKK